MVVHETTPLYPLLRPSPGTPVTESPDTPTLFTPLQVRGLKLQNRIAVTPMGTFSANNGHLNDFHLVHYGSFALKGASLVIVEATGVAPNGRVSTRDSGLWKDSQIPPLKRVVDFIHSQGQKAGIQLCHSGRKGSMLPPWLAKGDPMVHFPLATEADGGWPDDVWAPSAIPCASDYPMPKAMGIEQIDLAVDAFANAARRAIQAGVDFIELHGAHGYLIHQFLSPLTNHRTDEYGGTFENRARFLIRVLEAVRNVIPGTVALSLRISAIEWMEWSGQYCWTLEDSIKLAKLLPQVGVDVLDVSSGGNHHDQKIDIHPYYQVDLAGKIRQALHAEGIELLVAAVGFIDNAKMAESIVHGSGSRIDQKTEYVNGNNADKEKQAPQADLVLVGREFLRDTEFVLKAASDLDVQVQWPLQYLKGQNKK
ncbi:NADH-dependent flavin oxidoreductase [Fusarium torreyae]|uniref:NADH-dependent flavin oxidoreductase n=1 Tax=Fusarium torreyae TaxID=1237075 RepID=A0A9W8RUW9_9HYPO|nr:NADH-dependent flavin oxidoreductase [Fusarium torreyae]